MSPASIVTKWLTAPIPGYAVVPDTANEITSPSPAHDSAFWIVANGDDGEFSAHETESTPDGATA